MNIQKKVLFLGIMGVTSLFSANFVEIDTLAKKIKNADDVIVKQELIIELNDEVEKLDNADAIKAQSIIDAILIPVK